jgi:hypothetical protein
MLDHAVKNNKVRYTPPTTVLKELEKHLPDMGGIPIKVFLYYLDLLGLNEDVKVYTLGHIEFKDYGRINTLLTFCHLISVFLNRHSISKFAGSFSRPPSGMSPIRRSDIREVFPLLDENFEY